MRDYSGYVGVCVCVCVCVCVGGGELDNISSILAGMDLTSLEILENSGIF